MSGHCSAQGVPIRLGILGRRGGEGCVVRAASIATHCYFVILGEFLFSRFLGSAEGIKTVHCGHIMDRHGWVTERKRMTFKIDDSPLFTTLIPDNPANYS